MLETQAKRSQKQMVSDSVEIFRQIKDPERAMPIDSLFDHSL